MATRKKKFVPECSEPIVDKPIDNEYPRGYNDGLKQAESRMSPIEKAARALDNERQRFLDLQQEIVNVRARLNQLTNDAANAERRFVTAQLELSGLIAAV